MLVGNEPRSRRVARRPRAVSKPEYECKVVGAETERLAWKLEPESEP